MKILHLSTHDSRGGAAIATKRLHEALLAQGADSWMLCDFPSGNTPNSVGLRDKSIWLKEKFRNRWDRLTKAIQRDPDSFYLSLNSRGNALLEKVASLQPDIVNIHWVGKNFLHIEDLPILCSRYPVVWTLHDMWPFCGAEHYAYSEDRWRNGYEKTNRTHLARCIDLNRLVWQRKLTAWTGCTIHTISVSNWMNECVKQSKLFQGIKGTRNVIHNGIDMETFTPLRKRQSQPLNNNNTNHNRHKICYLSTRLSNTIKGIHLFIEAMHSLHANKINLDITTFGGPPIPNLPPLGKIQHIGRIAEPTELVKLYASVDLLVTASRMESFGLTAAESLACGTPVVCFDTSGLRDIVQHKQNGYRAECFSPDSLAEGIQWCLADPKRYQNLQAKARPSVADRFSIETIASKTLALYKKLHQWV